MSKTLWLLAIYDCCSLNLESYGYTTSYEKAVEWKDKMKKEHPLKDTRVCDYGFEELKEVVE
jgi:hypothetical protein